MNKLEIGLLVTAILLIVYVAIYDVSQQIYAPTIVTTSVTETERIIETGTEEKLTTIVTTSITETKQIIRTEAGSRLITFVTISATEASQLIETELYGRLIILDVRPNYAYSREHLEGAINIPIERLRESVEMPEKSKGHVILVYSQTGVTGSDASQILINNGFTQVYNMDGGIRAWISEGLPVMYPGSTEGCGCK